MTYNLIKYVTFHEMFFMKIPILLFLEIDKVYWWNLVYVVKFLLIKYFVVQKSKQVAKDFWMVTEVVKDILVLPSVWNLF